ncbi:flavo protein family [Coniella lustricola]|uniref:Flavin prenyltransferase PAD1, mitochondrial n=1 Tax=Coniella lustricola TaxID=2025994 RepID=A0A2T3ANI0_9PEZI|nr:flavo protein family [Coniella lustricola]
MTYNQTSGASDPEPNAQAQAPQAPSASTLSPSTTNATNPTPAIPSSLAPPRRRKRVIVALTGATGAQLGVATLLALRRLSIETHLIISKWGDATLKYETAYTPSAVRALADHSYSNHDLAAPIASGSFRVDGMVVVPCSMKTLAGINAGYCDDLISRAADVMLKERKRLVLVTRECPLSGIHLQNMLSVTQHGAVIFPPVPAFYIRPSSVEELVDHTVGRVLDLFDLETDTFSRWEGFQKA